MSRLSSNQLLALAAAAPAGLVYSVAGWHAPGEFSTFASTTLLALEKRGLLTIAGPYKRRIARLTAEGRALTEPKPRTVPSLDKSGVNLERAARRASGGLTPPSPLLQPTEQSS